MTAIEIVDAADPDAPNRTIRRARRVDPLRALDLADREWAAAERLRDDAALSVGYREDGPTLERVDWSRSSVHYTDSQIDALGRMARLSSLGMPGRQWDVLQCVVLHWRSLDETARELRMRRAAVPVALRQGLAALVEFYG